MKNKVAPESSSSEESSYDDSEHESVAEESENEEKDDLPKKFDLSQMQKRLEDAPPSSSDEEDSDPEDDDPESEDEDKDDEEQADNDDIEDETNDDENKGSGWADAMAKVLNTGKNVKSDKPMLLSKAKKDVQKYGLENDKPKERPALARAKRKEMENAARKKPDIVKDKAKEKRLTKIATRGVVQLFNAVREQQKSLKTQLDKAGLSTTKRDKVFKNLDKDAFLDVLSGKKRTLSSASISGNGAHNSEVKKPKTEVKAEDVNQDDDGTWSVLKDNFMMGAKMKDWDKESDDE